MAPLNPETQTQIARLEQRMEAVESRVEKVEETRPTKQEVELMVAASVPSREDFKTDMTGVLVQYLSGDNQSKRNTKVEIVKAIAYVVGGGTIGTIALALLNAPK